MLSWRKSTKLIYQVFSKQKCRCLSTHLSEVGKFEVPKSQGKYETGQLFLHKVLGYRGVILFPWLARMFDRNLNQPKSSDPFIVDDLQVMSEKDELNKSSNLANSSTNGDSASENNLNFNAVTYYQVLIDQTDSVHFLGQHSCLHCISGLDYVSHNDILPYMSSSTCPIHHELFDKFLTPDSDKLPSWTKTNYLDIWHEKNYSWLELTDVHREITEGVRVTVMPFFMGITTNQKNRTYWWRYCVRLENLSKETIQLRECHWRLFSNAGTFNPVRGRGVVGYEPILSPTQPAFEYSSHVPLQTPSGNMWGTFKMERENGHLFEVRIPPFSLESKD